MATSPIEVFSSVTGIFKEYLMMDGDVARQSSGNDDFDIIGGDDDPKYSTSDGDGMVVLVEVDVVANGDDSSISKQPVDMEFTPKTLNGDAHQEEEIANGRIEQEEDGKDEPKASAEDLMNEFGISLDSGAPDEETNEDGNQDKGELVEDEVAATTFKTEEASVTLEALSAEKEVDPVPENVIENLEDTAKDIPEEDPGQDSAVDVTLDTSQDTSLDISQDISLDVSVDKAPEEEPQESPQESYEDVKETPAEPEETPEEPQETPAEPEETPAEPEKTPEEPQESPVVSPTGQDLLSEDASGSELMSPTSPKPILERLISWERVAKENEGYRPGLTRSKSSRLDSSKFSKFEHSSSAQSSDSDTSSSSKRHTIVGAGRLNMSRFSQFEQNSDSSDGGSSRPIKRSAVGRSKSLKFGMGASTPELCTVCQKRVYPMEKITADTVIYHKTCFRCAECKKCLSLGNYAACQGNVFCRPHFKQMFKLKGNYDFTNQVGSPRQTNGVSELGDNPEAFNFNMEASHLESPRLVEDLISASENQSEESAPPPVQSPTPSPTTALAPAEVVRSSDQLDEAMSVEGGTGSVKSRFESGSPTDATTNDRGVSESTPIRREDVVQSSEAADEVKVTAGGIRNLKSMFEKGSVTNLEVKTNREPVSIGSLDNYESSAQGGHVAESTPVIRDDIIRSSDNAEDPGIQKGLSRSLKNRFETEKISNIETKPKEKIEISTPIEKRTYQPPERQARPDIVNAESQAEDPGIQSGQARSLRSLFEKGNVSNVEERPKGKLDRTPKSLDEYSSQEGVSENNPVAKEDVVSSSTLMDEPMKAAESAKSMKQRWETGQVERVPEKPKPSLERIPQSLDTYSMTMVVSENTPQERTDIVKSSSTNDEYLASRNSSGGSAGSIKAKWESGEVQNAENTAQKESNDPKRFSAMYEEQQTNGEVERENGVAEEEEEEEEEDNSIDASWEIKAARAAAMAEAADE